MRTNSLDRILKTYWGYNEFRQLQLDIISSVMDGVDTIALLPTGGGKSLCYQVPALAMGKIAIVISPLIALMEDQVKQLKDRGIRAEKLVSGTHIKDIDRILENCALGKVDFLYVSPERLQSDLVQERIKRMDVGLLAIDEAHCISQWGYDFRPPYLEISKIRELMPGTPCIALTASATSLVLKDIETYLGLKSPSIYRKSFLRSNLEIDVVRNDAKDQQILDWLNETPGSAIIYVRSRKQTAYLSRKLESFGVSCTFYHAGLTREERSHRQEYWIKGKIRVMIATNAFGMGIDKPDVRQVIHIDLPDGLESYYQEAGRAGRDGLLAHCRMVLGSDDVNYLIEKTERSIPKIEDVKDIYERLTSHLQIAIGEGMDEEFDIDIIAFSDKIKRNSSQVMQIMMLFERYGLFELEDGFTADSKVQIELQGDALWDFIEKHPRYASVIQALLRGYGGITTTAVSIKESNIAHLSGRPIGVVKEVLQELAENNMLKYTPRTMAMKMYWTHARYDLRYFPIRAKDLEQRANVVRNRMKSMIRFVLAKRECHFLHILEYFGEKGVKACGVCDNCKNSISVPLSPPKLEAAILEVLKEWNDSKVLLTMFRDNSPEEIVEVLRTLLDEDLIIRNEHKQWKRR